MNRRVTSSRFPYLLIRFHVRQHTYEEEALIDTGFDGGIAAPLYLFENAGPPDDYELWRPVVGPSILAPTFRGSFQVDALGPFSAIITALGDEIIVGLEAIAHFAVLLDHGRQVIVEP